MLPAYPAGDCLVGAVPQGTGSRHSRIHPRIAHSVRDVARITGLPRQTVHRWKTEPPGQKRLTAVRDALQDAGCG